MTATYPSGCLSPSASVLSFDSLSAPQTLFHSGDTPPALAGPLSPVGPITAPVETSVATPIASPCLTGPEPAAVPPCDGPGNTGAHLSAPVIAPVVPQGDTESSPDGTRPRLPKWLEAACRCPECRRVMVMTKGRSVACAVPGHTKLIGKREFGERVAAARTAARVSRGVRIRQHADTSVRQALRLVLYATTARFGRPQKSGRAGTPAGGLPGASTAGSPVLF